MHPLSEVLRSCRTELLKLAVEACGVRIPQAVRVSDLEKNTYKISEALCVAVSDPPGNKHGRATSMRKDSESQLKFFFQAQLTQTTKTQMNISCA